MAKTLRAMVAAAAAERAADARRAARVAQQQAEAEHYYHPDFTGDELGAVQLLPLKVLAAVARGEVDMNLVCRKELASRGMNAQGAWVGFAKAAEQLLGVK